MHSVSDVRKKLLLSGKLLETHILLSKLMQSRVVDGSEYDETVYDLLIRVYLAPQQQIRAVDICSQLLKSPSHISRILDDVEAQGLVTRSQDPDDKRAYIISLSEKGLTKVCNFLPELIAVLDDTIYRSLSKTEQKQLHVLLQKIIDHTEHQLYSKNT